MTKNRLFPIGIFLVFLVSKTGFSETTNTVKAAIRDHFKANKNLQIEEIDRIENSRLEKVVTKEGSYLVSVSGSNNKIRAFQVISKDCDCSWEKSTYIQKNVTPNLHLFQTSVEQDEDSTIYDGYVWNSQTGSLTKAYSASGINVQLQKAGDNRMSLLFTHGPDVGYMGEGDSLSLPTTLITCKKLTEKLEKTQQGQVDKITVDYQWAPKDKPQIVSCLDQSNVRFRDVGYPVGEYNCQGTFDTKGLSPEEIKNSLDLITGQWDQKDESFTSVFSCKNDSGTPTERTSQSMPTKISVHKAYDDLMASLKNLRLASALDDYRKRLIRFFQSREALELARAEFAITQDQKSIPAEINGQMLPQECTAMSDLLQIKSERDLIKSWESLNRAACLKINPQDSKTCDYNLKNQEDQMVKNRAARCDVILFDWSNCVTLLINADFLQQKKTALQQAISDVKCR